MLIAKVTDGAVVDVADYRAMFPSTSFASGPNDQFLAENGCMKVSAFVAHDRATQRLQPCDPYVQGGVVYTMEVVDKTAEELAAELAAEEARVRSQRNALLADTDWVVTKSIETNTDIRPEWKVYRQALRDITEQDGFPHAVIWPTKPE